ncbi:MAG: hypothetical protein L3V56_12250 [Candidatus Magnetoovum sp. WYHC-5]|nr:hypothetical protein [Candidatus Magnetoovum sp. WYHC-5]
MTNIKPGINGLGRIGKLTLWYHVANCTFKEIVINVGREAGKTVHDIARYIETDSTYGTLQRYLYGFKEGKTIEKIDESKGTIEINGTKIEILRKTRNPAEIGWANHDVELVMDTTGKFLDPTLAPDNKKGSLQGHLASGAKKVIASAPFKIKDKSLRMPDEAVTIIMGINESDYDPQRHNLISSASCTTICLAHMIKPILDEFDAKRILTASMATVHAATGSQEVLDRLPKEGDKDLRKNRSILNNIILTTTGAADTLGLVLPQMKSIGFMAESVRIPTTTGSLVILILNIQEEGERITINKEVINAIYEKAASDNPYLLFTDEQNVSSDIIALPRAAAIIEGHETHTRSAEITIDIDRVLGIDKDTISKLKDKIIKVPLTQVVVYGWYDNELGEFTYMFSELMDMIAKSM